jgi:hypothetical protein
MTTALPTSREVEQAKVLLRELAELKASVKRLDARASALKKSYGLHSDGRASPSAAEMERALNSLRTVGLIEWSPEIAEIGHRLEGIGQVHANLLRLAADALVSRTNPSHSP